MYAEDVYKRDYDIRSVETAYMEHEDLHSQLRERYDMRTAQAKVEYLEFLEDLYTPHQPYKFKTERIMLPTLHSVLCEGKCTLG